MSLVSELPLPKETELLTPVPRCQTRQELILKMAKLSESREVGFSYKFDNLGEPRLKMRFCGTSLIISFNWKLLESDYALKINGQRQVFCHNVHNYCIEMQKYTNLCNEFALHIKRVEDLLKSEKYLEVEKELVKWSNVDFDMKFSFDYFGELNNHFEI